jgi:hypothetical protein
VGEAVRGTYMQPGAKYLLAAGLANIPIDVAKGHRKSK